MTQALIFQPAKNAMQSGMANTRRWFLEYEPASPRLVDPLTGWTGTRDARAQIRLEFETREDAVAYAERKGLDFRVREPKARTVAPKNYADKFRWDTPK